MPDGYLSEFDTTLEAVFAAHPPERVIFGLDANILVRDESGLTGALPEYLYNANTQEWKYDVKFYGIESLMRRFLRPERGGRRPGTGVHADRPAAGAHGPDREIYQ